jgi:SAM-dependent methyltransferase
MPLQDNSVAILVASLGDPYNEPAFWREAHRVLKPGGVVLFTTPAYEWAEKFRRASNSAPDLAEFKLANGRLVGVRSLVQSEDDQLDMIKDSGLEVVKVAHATVRDLAGVRLSSKLVIDGHGDHLRIVTGYLAKAKFG